MPKHVLYVFAAVAALCIIAVVGYMRPAPEADLPVKVLFPSPNSSAVVFTHAAHVEEYQVDCTTCHHESPVDRPDPQPCGACHGQTFDEEFAQTHIRSFIDENGKPDLDACFTCHHLEFNLEEPVWTREMHNDHADMYTSDCTDCHHTEEIEPEPESCANCHEAMDHGNMPPVDDFMPTYRDAVHERCASCHENWLDEGLDGCANCHAMSPARDLMYEEYSNLQPGDRPERHFTDCVACHYMQDMSPQDLMLPRDQAFHTQCMSCHEEAGAGPYPMPPDQVKDKRDESRHCAQCHTG